MIKANGAEEHTDIQLKTPWTVWEYYRAKGKATKTGDYDTNLYPVIKFETLNEFGQIWNNYPHKKIADMIFADETLTELNEYKVDADRLEVIDALCLFRNDAKPAWEDPANEGGGEFRVSISEMTKDEINDLWEKLVFSFISEEQSWTQHVVGMRFLNKLLLEKIMRLEVWVNFKDEQKSLLSGMNEDLKKFLTGECGIPESRIRPLQWMNH